MKDPAITLTIQIDTPKRLPLAEASPMARETPPHNITSPNDSSAGGSFRSLKDAIHAVNRGIEDL